MSDKTQRLKSRVEVYVKLNKLTFEESAELFDFSSRQAFWQWMRGEGERWTTKCAEVEAKLNGLDQEDKNPLDSVRRNLMQALAELDFIEGKDNTDEELD